MTQFRHFPDDEFGGWDLKTGKVCIALFAGAVQVWSLHQKAPVSVADAMRAFNVEPGMIVEAVRWHAWMFLMGPGGLVGDEAPIAIDDYAKLIIEHEGE